MLRILLVLLLAVPAVVCAQDTTSCAPLANDLNGDFIVGATDILQLLSAYGENYDVDGDSIPDCDDPCVGEYDECGVCNGPGPQVLAIDSIIVTLDSVYVAAIDDWLVYELDADTVLTLVCENPGCTDPDADNYDPYAEEGGSCVYGGFACGQPWTFDGHDYATVEIGSQCWFAENLRTTVYANGDLIPSGLTDGEWTSTTAGATAVYGEGSSTCFNNSPEIDACDEAQSLAAYGRLYNWYAVGDARSLCPAGWHVPTDGEFTELEDYITSQGFSGTEGTALKSTGGWNEQWGGFNGTDDFGFSALPGGGRGYIMYGDFDLAGADGYWWSSSAAGDAAWYRGLYNFDAGIFRDDGNPQVGLSVRCLRDAEIPEVQGCTDPAYIEYDSTATADDGSCFTLASTCIEVEMDGHIYGVVQIGDQCWFAENLRTAVYANGDVIPAGLSDGEWTSTTAGATAVYGEGSSTCNDYSPDIDACDEAQSLEEYGRLYNWYAVDDSRGLCPSGWHVPTDGEWTELEDYITSQGFDGTEGTALKSTGGWSVNGNGTDDFGFSALPGGYRLNNFGYFFNAGDSGSWWSSSPNGGVAWFRYLYGLNQVIVRYYDNPRAGFSVRCLRDAE